MWQKFTQAARTAIFYAQEEAVRAGQFEVSPEHMLIGLLRAKRNAVVVLESLGVQVDSLERAVRSELPKGSGLQGHDLQLAASAKRAIDLAYDTSKGFKDGFIGTEHFLLGLARLDEMPSFLQMLLGGAKLGKGPAFVALAGSSVTLQALEQSVACLPDRRQSESDE